MNVDDVAGDPTLVVTGGYRSVGRYCVIGHPIAHSMSPTLHNAWFAKEGLGFQYVALDIPPSQLVVRAPALPFEYSGVNVTIPHKVAILGFVDRVDADAEAAGASNLLYRAGETKEWTAGNTDGAGFVRGFEEEMGEPVTGRDVLLFGAGGAARAVAAAIMAQRPGSLTIANRSQEPAVALAKRVGATAALSLSADVIHRCERRPDLLVNTMSLDAEPFFDALELEALDDAAVLCDLNYHHRRPRLLQRGEDAGLFGIDGRGMFLWQAALSFERWFGTLPDLDLGRRVLGM